MKELKEVKGNRFFFGALATFLLFCLFFLFFFGLGRTQAKAAVPSSLVSAQNSVGQKILDLNEGEIVLSQQQLTQGLSQIQNQRQIPLLAQPQELMSIQNLTPIELTTVIQKQIQLELEPVSGVALKEIESLGLRASIVNAELLESVQLIGLTELRELNPILDVLDAGVLDKTLKV